MNKESSSPLLVEGDPVRLEQVFSNLLTNASKYSDPGDQITLSIAKQGDYAEIAVSDQGIGIHEHELEHIFTPFHQAGSKSRTQKGLGIGLALVQNFVEVHGGSVTAASEGPGLGSRFTVLLPLANDEAAEEIRSRERRAPSRTKGAKGTRVLIVDDNDAAAWSLGRLLELRNATVAYAYDGRQAIEKALTEPYDTVILDVGLPDQDGYSVAKVLRVRGYEGRLIALTGFSNEDARERGKEAGFDHYLVKPAGLSDLKRVMPELA